MKFAEWIDWQGSGTSQDPRNTEGVTFESYICDWNRTVAP